MLAIISSDIFSTTLFLTWISAVCISLRGIMSQVTELGFSFCSFDLASAHFSS
jgi:hypothetical protein